MGCGGRGMKQLLGICLVILLGLFSEGVRAAETPAPPQAEEESVTEKKPPEKPPEVLPQYVPGVTPMAPYAPSTTTLEPGPMTGALAPYGYGAAQDTLMRGWQTHKLGALTVSPYLEYDALYRTNLFQTYSNKKSDFANMVSPGLRFELPVAGTHKLSLGYLGNYFGYTRFSDNSHYDQNVNVDAALNFSKLSIRAGNTFRNATEEPTLQQAGPSATFSRERPYNRETPYFNAAYKMGDRWRLEANYQFDAIFFTHKVDRINNFQDNTLGATIFYKFWPKTSALVQYIADIRGHSNDSGKNNVVQTPMVGLTWDPTAKLSGTIKFGYTIANYDQIIPFRNNAPSSWALSIQTVYKLGRYTQMSLIAQRSIQEDTDNNNNPYYNTGLAFTVSHYLHYFNVTSYASCSYYNNNYIFQTLNPNTTQLKMRVDNVFYAGVGLSRPITRWLKVKLDYLYFNRGSNFNFYPTNEHKVLFGIQTSF